jgi:hypothetical protein
MSMSRFRLRSPALIGPLTALALTACGAEVAPAAAAIGARQASQAEDGRRQAEQVRQQLEDTVRAREAAASAALEQAR